VQIHQRDLAPPQEEDQYMLNFGLGVMRWTSVPLPPAVKCARCSVAPNLLP